MPSPCWGGAGGGGAGVGEGRESKSAQSLNMAANSPCCNILKEIDHIKPSHLCAGLQLQLQVFPHLLLGRSPIATGFFVWLAYVCLLLLCVDD